MKDLLQESTIARNLLASRYFTVSSTIGNNKSIYFLSDLEEL